MVMIEYNPIKYFIIIPHCNIPGLLIRSLKSIPKRQDIHVLIVDDNSNSNIVDFDHFPGKDNEQVTVLCNKVSKGVGHARNIALEYLKTQNWDGYIVFLDADDFFVEGVDALFEAYKDADADMIFFRTRGVNSDTLEPTEHARYVDDKVIKALKTRDFDELRYNVGPVWSRFIKFSLIVENHLLFPEIVALEDTVISAHLGVHAGKIETSDQFLYVYTQRSGSLVTNSTLEFALVKYKAAKQVTEYLKNHSSSGYTLTQYNVIWHWTNLAHINLIQGIKELPSLMNLCNPADIQLALLKVIKRKLKYTFVSKQR